MYGLAWPTFQRQELINPSSSRGYLPLYGVQKTNWDPQYACEFFNSKGRVNEYLLGQPSDLATSAWTVLLSGPYMEQLQGGVRTSYLAHLFSTCA